MKLLQWLIAITILIACFAGCGECIKTEECRKAESTVEAGYTGDTPTECKETEASKQ